MSEERQIDFSALVRGLLQDVRDAYNARPPREIKRSESSGITRIEQEAVRLRSDRDAALDSVESMYRERAHAAGALLTRRQTRIEAYAKRERRVVTPDPDKFIVAGRVLDAATGVGLPNVTVNAFDVARKREDTLGSTHTDALGYFRFEYTAAELEKLGGRTSASIEVLDASGAAISTSDKTFAPKLGGAQFVTATVDGDMVPTQRDLGNRIDASVTGWIQDIQRRIRLSKPQGDFSLKDLRVKTPVAQPEVESEPQQPVKTPVKPESLEDIKGIGPQSASKLVEAGITDIGSVATMKPESLAEILKTSVNNAEAIVVDARRVAKIPESEP